MQLPSFAFPTLPELALLRIGVHLTNKKIGPFSGFPKSVWDGSYPSKSYVFQFHDVVASFKIPDNLKPELSDVLTGLYEQVRLWLLGSRRGNDEGSMERFFPIFKELELFFDVHGRFNVVATWENYFAAQLAVSGNLEKLVYLLRMARYHHLLSHMDTVLRKIMDIVADGTQLDGPTYALNPGDELTVSYKFLQKLEKLSVTPQLRDLALIDNEGVVFTLDSGRDSISSIKKRLELAVPSNRFSMAATKILCTDDPVLLSQLLQLVDEILLGRVLMTLKEHRLFKSVLRPFLEWPFAEWFFYLIDQWSCYINTLDYFDLFHVIVEMIPENTEYGTYHSDILLQFWNVIPIGYKTEFEEVFWDYLRSNEKGEKYDLMALEILQEKNSLLSKKIIEEFMALGA